jgi:hypothetical protein
LVPVAAIVPALVTVTTPFTRTPPWPEIVPSALLIIVLPVAINTL